MFTITTHYGSLKTQERCLFGYNVLYTIRSLFTIMNTYLLINVLSKSQLSFIEQVKNSFRSYKYVYLVPKRAGNLNLQYIDFFLDRRGLEPWLAPYQISPTGSSRAE